MASKRTTAKKTPGKFKTRAELKKLLAKAQAEIAKLLRDQKAGILPQKELKAGLNETKKYLKAMEPFDRYHRH